MTRMNHIDAKHLAEWLGENVDSHSVYDPVGLFSNLDGAKFVPKWNSDGPSAVLQYGGLDLHVPVTTVGNVRAQMEADPRGGTMDPDWAKDSLAVAGHDISQSFDYQVTGSNGGGSFFGRGTAHRAAIAHLATWDPEPVEATNK